MPGRPIAAVAAIATCVASSLAGCAGSPCGASEAKVMRVIDGDTIVLEGDVRIRYLLIDTPETDTSDMSKSDCFGENAKQMNSDLVLGKTVKLHYDVECADRFNRTLAYITVDGQEINSLLVQRGYACVLHIPPNGESRVEEFRGLQLDAKNARRGLWGACNPLPPACT
jgi:micrococcal nuclease